jgi:hypothetical protein
MAQEKPDSKKLIKKIQFSPAQKGNGALNEGIPPDSSIVALLFPFSQQDFYFLKCSTTKICYIRLSTTIP